MITNNIHQNKTGAYLLQTALCEPVSDDNENSDIEYNILGDNGNSEHASTSTGDDADDSDSDRSNLWPSQKSLQNKIKPFVSCFF